MCGILGFLTNDHFPDSGKLDKAASFLKYRGPDDFGKEEIKGEHSQLFLYHSRLSIIDLTETGHQPMISPSGKMYTFEHR